MVPVTCPATSAWGEPLGAEPGFRLSHAALAAVSRPAVSIARSVVLMPRTLRHGGWPDRGLIKRN